MEVVLCTVGTLLLGRHGGSVHRAVSPGCGVNYQRNEHTKGSTMRWKDWVAGVLRWTPPRPDIYHLQVPRFDRLCGCGTPSTSRLAVDTATQPRNFKQFPPAFMFPEIDILSTSTIAIPCPAWFFSDSIYLSLLRTMFINNPLC